MKKLFFLVFVLFSSLAQAQPEVDALRIYLGTTGSSCAVHSGTGAPASGLGAVCDYYIQKDTPYTVYSKTGASTWSEMVRVPGSTGITTTGALGTGSITSGFGAIDVGADSITGATVFGTTSLSSPTLTAAANLTVSPVGDVVVNPTGNDVLPGTGYDINIGALTNKFLTLHAAELWVETLVAQDTMATIGGRILVGPTTILTSDLASGATSMAVRHNQLANGDRVVMQANGSLEWMAITSSPSGGGPYTYSITRNLDGSGANNWTAGDAVFNTGTTNDGFIDLYSVSGVIPGSTAGPTIVGNVRTGATYSNVASRWAIGNLNGLYGYGADTYGAAFGDAANTNVTIDATNGIRFRNSTTSTLSISGSQIDLVNTGVIRSGSATALGAGNGVWLAANSGTPQFRVGDPAGNRVSWDGTNLTLTSANATIDQNGVVISLPTGGSPSTTNSYRFNSATGTMGVFGYRDAGDTNRALLMQTTSTSTGITVGASIAASNGTTSTSVETSANASGGGVRLNAGITSILDVLSTSEIELKANVVEFGNPIDLTVFTNDSTTTANPYIRSDGNLLVINSRSDANGGGLYLQQDSVATTYIGHAGGLTNIYAPLWGGIAPRWPAALTQSTVGVAGSASALPANPAAYIHIADSSGNVFLVPAYNRP